jgi:hypothetical protein
MMETPEDLFPGGVSIAANGYGDLVRHKRATGLHTGLA